MERHCYLGNFTVRLLLLEFFAPMWLVSKNIAFGAVQSFLTLESNTSALPDCFFYSFNVHDFLENVKCW